MADTSPLSRRSALVCAITAIACVVGLAGPPTTQAEPGAPARPDAPRVDFNRDVRPILASKCFACHGPDSEQAQGGLRLDLREIALAAGAITPGQPHKSSLVERIASDDPDAVMPPPSSRKTLDDRERQILTDWIATGADYQTHWAFVPPRQPARPSTQQTGWAKTPVDDFVLAELERHGLRPNPPASRETLIRRVSLDVRGLPPTLAEIDEYLADTTPNATAAMIDRLLASPRYGEKMALLWMDLSRYGDTNGYHYDSTRQVWLWRDWVMAAYNANMPYDQFSIEQLAGDLLANPTTAQRIASGFNRHTRYNEEGGADPNEFRVRYAVDRAQTLGQVWLGLTVHCAECHSHKYDPISQREFYQLYAFFNNLDEPGSQGHNQKYPPLVTMPNENQNQRLAELKAQLAAHEAALAAAVKAAADSYVEPPAEDLKPPPDTSVEFLWLDDDTPRGATLQGDPQSGGDPIWHWVSDTPQTPHPVFTGQRSLRRRGTGLNQHFFTEAAEPVIIAEGDRLFAHVWIDPTDPPKAIQLQFYDGSWAHRATWGENLGHSANLKGPANHKAGGLPAPGTWVRLEVTAAAVGLAPGAKLTGWAFTQFGGTVYYDAAGLRTGGKPPTSHTRSLVAWAAAASAADKSLPESVRAALKIPADKRSDAHRQTLREYFVAFVWQPTKAKMATLRERVSAAAKHLTDLEETIPFQLVSVELAQPRPARVLMRGDFQKPGETVTPGVPAILPPLPTDGPANRLALARWLFDPRHPLTARVAVNRYWSQLFGRGLVETPGDFGTQGRHPTHPELLDWLATEYLRTHWDTKALLRVILNSATYQQSSLNDHRHDDRDPDNRLLWRAPRFRLWAEEVRDVALAASGLLDNTLGGPPVFPPQPPQYYNGKLGGWKWPTSTGPSRYRRGLYTFWRRTTPHPSFVVFDAPDRSECTVERPRTNTPLQALTTLNDPQFVEAARVLAQRVLTEAPADTTQRLVMAFRLVTARRPDATELAILTETLAAQQRHFAAHPQTAKALATVGEAPNSSIHLDVTEHAAWTALANILLNLDEAITRE